MSWQTSENPLKGDKKHREEESAGDYKTFMNNDDELGWNVDVPTFAHFVMLSGNAEVDANENRFLQQQKWCSP